MHVGDGIGEANQATGQLESMPGPPGQVQDRRSVPADLAETLGVAAEFLDESVVDLGLEGLGADLDTQDPRLGDLAMAVLGYQMLNELLTGRQHRHRIKGNGREKVEFAAMQLQKLSRERIAELAGGTLDGVAWKGPDDPELYNWALLVVSAGQLGYMRASFDAMSTLQRILRNRERPV